MFLGWDGQSWADVGASQFEEIMMTRIDVAFGEI